MRNAEIIRTTAETDIRLSLALDGNGAGRVETGVGFLDHMLTLFARHGRFDLSVSCRGDTQVDDHHSVEDVGIALGDAFAQAIGEKRGVRRYAGMLLPMDEALVLCAVDLSGRSCLRMQASFPSQKIGTFDAASSAARRDKQPPYRRGDVQGVRPHAQRGGCDRSAPRRRNPLDQGHAVSW